MAYGSSHTEKEWEARLWARDAAPMDVLPDPRGVLSRPFRNDPALFELVRVKAIRAFYVSGKIVEVGEVVLVPRHVASELLHVKVEMH